MHPTLSEVNIKTSLKLFFNEKFDGIVPIMYDKSVTDPYVSTTNMGEVVDRWLTILFRATDKADVSEVVTEIFCCSRKDTDNMLIEELVDEVNAVLFPENGHLTIPLYNVQSETVIGNLFFLKQLYGQTGIFTAIDGTKYQIISVPFRWIACI